ncbi:hypothetical protein CLU79DRAFT_878157, partial [Phycomyces nitens]
WRGFNHIRPFIFLSIFSLSLSPHHWEQSQIKKYNWLDAISFSFPLQCSKKKSNVAANQNRCCQPIKINFTFSKMEVIFLYTMLLCLK